jgi:hypothetical protein
MMSSKEQRVRGEGAAFSFELARMKYLQSKSYPTMAVAVAMGLTFTATAIHAADQDWKAGLISPVANPIYFEDARITSEVRPIFMQHWLPSRFDFANGGNAPLDGEVRVYALQLRYALTERLAFIATKDGYIEFKPEGVLASDHAYGFADIAFGFKYALVDDAEKQLLITPGLTITVPTGSDNVFQGDGSGEWNLFVSGAKGFNDLHLLGNLGFRLPNNTSEQTVQAHYSLQLDYRVHSLFVPFVSLNGYTMLTDGDDRLPVVSGAATVPLNTEMYDLINYGSGEVAGTTQIVLGAGFRSNLTEDLSVGVAYEAGTSTRVGIFDSRLTVDSIFRF